MTMKELLKKIEKQSDKDAMHYLEIHPLAANYHRGYRDAIHDLFKEMEMRNVGFTDDT